MQGFSILEYTALRDIKKLRFSEVNPIWFTSKSIGVLCILSKIEKEKEHPYKDALFLSFSDYAM